MKTSSNSLSAPGIKLSVYYNCPSVAKPLTIACQRFLLPAPNYTFTTERTWKFEGTLQYERTAEEYFKSLEYKDFRETESSRQSDWNKADTWQKHFKKMKPR